MTEMKAPTVFAEGPHYRFYLGDARSILPILETGSVDCVVTSPPYFRQRRYNGGSAGEIGDEKRVEDYVANLARIGRELYRVLKETGSFWLNIGDKCVNKDWLGIPWRVAFAMKDMGWRLRNEVIWHKPKHLPNAAKDRLAYAHEQFFHFVKSSRAYYDMDSTREPPQAAAVLPDGRVRTPTGVSGEKYRRQIIESASLSETEKENALVALEETLGRVRRGDLPDFRMLIRGTQRPTHGDSADLSGRAKELETRGFAVLTYHRKGSAPTDVWSVQVEDSIFPDNHFAVFPEALIERPVQATCPTGGVVLDPFLGSGTTAVVAIRLGRRALAIDTSAEYLEFAKKRIAHLLRNGTTLDVFAKLTDREGQSTATGLGVE